jgi:hypothetical protein
MPDILITGQDLICVKYMVLSATSLTIDVYLVVVWYNPASKECSQTGINGTKPRHIISPAKRATRLRPVS